MMPTDETMPTDEVMQQMKQCSTFTWSEVDVDHHISGFNSFLAMWWTPREGSFWEAEWRVTSTDRGRLPGITLTLHPLPINTPYTVSCKRYTLYKNFNSYEELRDYLLKREALALIALAGKTDA